MPVNDPHFHTGDRRTSGSSPMTSANMPHTAPTDPAAHAEWTKRIQSGAESHARWRQGVEAEGAGPALDDRILNHEGQNSRDLFATGVAPKAAAQWYRDEEKNYGKPGGMSHQSRQLVQRLKDADRLTPQMGWG